ncbi:MAG TPA: hypothetical protein VMI30_06430 [Stellaceae bacterium]|nr:hypothetical protein [Stellaceae bacterium]
MKNTIPGVAELGQLCAGRGDAGVVDPRSDWPDPEAFGDFSARRRLAERFYDVIADALHGALS